MNRRELLASVALGSVASTAGCINLAGGGGGDDGGDGGTQTTIVAPDDYGLELCSETDEPIYRIGDPDLEIQDENRRAIVRFTLDYVGPNQDAFSVSPTINLQVLDENGEQIGTLNKAETMSPTAVKNLEYGYAEGNYADAAGFTFDVVSPRTDGDAGCFLPEGIPTETASGGDGGNESA